MQLARLHSFVVGGEPAAAREVFEAGVKDIPSSREIWLAFLEFEASLPGQARAIVGDSFQQLQQLWWRLRWLQCAPITQFFFSGR
ncbi:unnamed protein product [Discosporangium mesarthrocarpum]